VVILFEGRDAAGKGGAIGAYLQELNPRFNMSVALPKPSDREQTQWYFQRYVDWLPAAGEQVLFDRSWYNRAGVEPVMGFCTPEQTTKFLKTVPHFEEQLVEDGIRLFKFYLSIGREMQMKRFHDRRHDILKRWKLSPVDLEALTRFDAYTEARNRMLETTSTKAAPWRVVLANDKRRTRVNVIRTVLHKLDYVGKDEKALGEIDGKIVLNAEDFLDKYRDD
jgi:polyphosphate kinase